MKVPLGYKAVERNGQVLYCRAIQETGTRFTRTQCMTPDELVQYERDLTEMRQEMQRRSNVCNSPTGNCGG